MDSNKRKAAPTRECQYAAGCYRKNPSHFGEYAHSHLTQIRQTGKNPESQQYTVPDELFMSQDIVLEQLVILDKLFPNDSEPAKKIKLEERNQMNSNAAGSSGTANKEPTVNDPGVEVDLLDSPVRASGSTRTPTKATKITDFWQSPKQEMCQSSKKIKTSPPDDVIDLLESPEKQGTKNLPLSLMGTPKITAVQLKDSLRATLEKVTTSQKPHPSPRVASNSQADQLAAYRSKHIQNRPKTTAIPTQASSSANYSRSTEVPGPSSSCTPSQPPPRNIRDYISVVNPRGEMAAKLLAAAPYNFFLTTITASKATHSEPLSITFQEILDPSLGEIESSVQMNFMVDIGWLLGHYYFAGCLDKPMLVLYGDGTPELEKISTKKPQVTAVKVQMSSPFGTHHTKMMLLGYKDGSMRVIVSTANLVEDDWHNRTQGIWMSPRCAAMPDGADTASGDSATAFRDDLVRYLVTYKLPQLQPWISRIRRSDFRDVNVIFVASVPGGHRDTPRGYDWGHARVGHLLSQHCGTIDETAPVVAQSSSIGSLGPNVHSWIMSDVANSFRRDGRAAGIRRLPAFRMIYPSYSNVKASHDDLLGGGCLPYRKAINDKQTWLKGHLQLWKSRQRHRSKAMPHIKTYCRWSTEGVYWFILTSANLSKAAWGAFNKASKLDQPLRIMSYEAGVLFLPKFVLDKDAKQVFPLGDNPKDGVPPFPMPYDLPLQPYSPDDTPFVMDYLLDNSLLRLGHKSRRIPATSESKNTNNRST